MPGIEEDLTEESPVNDRHRGPQASQPHPDCFLHYQHSQLSELFRRVSVKRLQPDACGKRRFRQFL